MPATQCFGQGRKGWTEHGGMGESNQISRLGGAQGGIGRMFGWWLYVELPQFGAGCALPRQDDGVIMFDGDSGSGEGHITSGVA